MGDDITIGVTEIVNNIEITAQPNDQIVDISVIDNADEVTLNITPTVVEINVNRGSSYARWGTIYGNLTDQTDLANALILKADLVDGKVPSYQLPSYVDDVIEVANYAALPTIGETGKIYLTLDNNKIYRWGGTVYVEIASNQAIWGQITGTLSNQTDLQNALNAKQNLLNGTGFVRMSGTSLSYISGSSSQFVKADGSLDSNVYALDSVVVKLTGDQTIRGTKTFLGNQTATTLKLILADYFNDGVIESDNGFIRLLNGSTELLNVNKYGEITSAKFIKSGGTAAEFLRADGSVASNVITGSGVTNYVPYFTSSGTLGGTPIIYNGTNIFVNSGLSVGSSPPATPTNGLSVQGNIITYGYVGIGTTSPSYRLQVKGNGFAVQGNNLNEGNSIRFLRASGTEMGYIGWSNESTNNSTWLFKSSNGNPIGFSADGTNQNMVINTNGNVGIGTTSPASFSNAVGLTIGDNDSTKTGFFKLKSTYNSGDGFEFIQFGNGDAYLSVNSSTNNLRLKPNGTVLVSSLGTGLVYSNGGTLTSTNPSDERLKDDVLDLKYGLNEILQLRPVSYNWKNDTINQGKQFGFIAQEVQEVMPELISEFTTIEDEEEVVRLGLDKEGIYAALVNAIKELKAEIELLKAK